MKRGTTAPALRHALVGNAFTAARRRGKQIVLDTRDPDVRVGVHLGMSGRVLVDDEEAGDPLRLREQPAHAEVAPLRRALRRRRRLHAPRPAPPRRGRARPRREPARPRRADAHRSRELDARARPAHRADQGGAHGPAPHRRPRQPARRRGAVAGGHRPDAGRRRRSTPTSGRCCTRRSARRCARSTGAAARTPATCRGTLDVAVPARRLAAAPAPRSAAAPPTGARRTSSLNACAHTPQSGVRIPCRCPPPTSS